MRVDLADYAVRLREYGFAPIALYRPQLDADGKVVGCNCWKEADCPRKSWGKHPVNPGWQSQTHLYLDLVHISAQFGCRADRNIGCVTGSTSGLLVIDIDVGDGKPGMQELQKLEQKVGPLPSTPTVITGSDGKHYYFRKPPETVLRNSASVIAPGIDVRGESGQAVLPPSLHQSGRHYRWAPGREPWQVPVAELPPDWVSLLLQPHAADVKRPTFPRQNSPRPARSTQPEMTLDQARALLVTMLEHPLINWACSHPNDVSREVWRGIATNLAIPVLEQDHFESIARQAFHAISRDYCHYSENETDCVFDDALHSADTHGPITFFHMQQHGAPDEECESQGGSSLVHAARRTLLRSSTCRT